MTIKLEIHAPGLDLHQERWNHHVLFMDRVHEHARRISACSWASHLRHGRGALYVDENQWMRIIKDNRWSEEVLFPCRHVAGTPDTDGIDTTGLGAGFIEMIENHEPETDVVLLVRHHPGTQLSCYLIVPDLAPPEAHATFDH